MKSIFDFILYEGVTYFCLDDSEAMNKVTQIAKKLAPLAADIIKASDGAIILKADDTIRLLGFPDAKLREKLVNLLGVSTH